MCIDTTELKFTLLLKGTVIVTVSVSNEYKLDIVSQ